MEEKLLESFEVGKAPEYLLTPCWSSAPLVPAGEKKEEKRDNSSPYNYTKSTSLANKINKYKPGGGVLATALLRRDGGM